MTVIDELPPSRAGAPGGEGRRPLELSERLSEPLRLVAKRARFLAWSKALCQLLALIAFIWLAMVLLLGWRFQIPLWIGIPLTLVGWAGVIYGSYRILYPLLSRKRGLASAALLVDGAMPDSEERISSAVELSQEENPAFRGSPELVACLIRQAEHHAETLDPGNVISGKDVRRWLSAFGSTLILWFLLFVLLTPNMMLGLHRMFAPWTAAAPLPSPILEVFPGDAVLAQGDRLEIKVAVKPPEGVTLDNGHEDIAQPILTQHFTGSAAAGAPDVAVRMERTGPREFHTIIDHAQQSFDYKVAVDETPKLGIGGAVTKDYNVTVHTKPAVADVEVQYTLPVYTHQQVQTEHSRDGTINALIGTTVRLIVHTTEPVESATFAVQDDGFGDARQLPLKEVADAATGNGAGQAAYAIEFVVRKSTEYRIKLAKKDGQTNPDDQPRTITARADAPPAVNVTNPDPKAPPLRVRPDDTITMRFVATDDYGVNKVVAVIDVDGKEVGTFDTVLGGEIGAIGEPRVTGEYVLKLPDVLKTATTKASQVGFKFRATDTRDPGPQTGESARQYLELDETAAPLARRLDADAAKELASAIQQAKQKLNDAEENLLTLRKNDKGQAMLAEDAQRLQTAQKNLAEARQLLTQGADQANGTRLAEMGGIARQVADGDVRKANDDAVAAGLASDQRIARIESEEGSAAHTRDALDKLTDLSNAMADAIKHQPLAQKLQDLAEKQRQLADALAQNPNDPKLLEEQKQLQRDLEQLVKDNPELQKQVADPAQNKLDDLVNKVRQLQDAQQPHQEQAKAAQDEPKFGEQAKNLARKQEDLNRQISDFTEKQDQNLKQAGAPPAPDKQKLDSIVKQLDQNQMEKAAKDEEDAADTLGQMQQKLSGSQKNADPAQQKAIDQAQKDAAEAANAQQKADDLAKKIQQAKADHDPPTRSNDPANKDATALADDMKQQAQDMSASAGANNAQRTAAQAAARAADAAKAAAQRGDADRAQQELSNAANQLAEAAKAEQTSAGMTPQQAQQNANNAAAAQKAGELADKQRDLADQTQRLAKQEQDAQKLRENAATAARQQRDLADQMSAAGREAQQLSQQTKESDPKTSQKTGDAAKSLDQAAQAQREAAQATGNKDSSQAAAGQEKTSERLGDAEEALTGQRRQTAKNDNPKNSNGQGNPGGGGQPSPPNNGQPAGGDKPPGGDQVAGGPPGSGARGGPPGGGTPGGSGGSQPGPADGAGQAAGGAPGGGQQGGPAQSVQGARDAQAQAAKGDAQAARRAAEQMEQAARQVAGAGGPGQGRGGNAGGAGAPGGGGPGDGPGMGPGGDGAGMAGNPGGGAGGGGGGIQLTDNGRSILPPKEVQDVGISPSTWARLAPEMRDQLLHAAQQPGPPAYRDMIARYYERIARLGPAPAPAGGVK